MIDISVYPREPERITYTPRADGGADVWLRRNIVKSADGGEEWTADEVYFHTTMSRADVEANFDTLFERDKLLNHGMDVESRRRNTEYDFRRRNDVKKELRDKIINYNKVRAANAKKASDLMTLLNALPPGQVKQLLKDSTCAELLKKYGIAGD